MKAVAIINIFMKTCTKAATAMQSEAFGDVVYCLQSIIIIIFPFFSKLHVGMQWDINPGRSLCH